MIPGLRRPPLRAVKEDGNPYVRELALAALTRIPPSPELLRAVSDAMKSDKDAVVQARAAAALGSLIRSAGGAKDLRDPAVKDLVAQFRLYGTGATRDDKDWGWREVGNALRMIGEDGEAALARLMGDEQDQRLADLAWRVVYLKQEDGFTLVTEEQDRAAHVKHPFMTFEATSK